MFAALFVGAVGCGKKKNESDETPSADKPAFTTKSRGVVKNVATGPKGTSLTIHHEAFPDWVNSRGEKRPMMSMTMDFKAGPKLDIGSIKAEDKIAFDVAVYYGENTRMVVTAATKLPSDTELELAGH
jgi:Cu/Ag efflux protein CusF